MPARCGDLERTQSTSLASYWIELHTGVVDTFFKRIPLLWFLSRCARRVKHCENRGAVCFEFDRQRSKFGQRVESEREGIIHYFERLAVRSGYDDRASVFARCEKRLHHTRHRTQASVECKLTEHLDPANGFCEPFDLLRCYECRHSYREVIPCTRLGQIGRRKIYRDALIRKLKRRIDDRATHTLPTLFNRSLWQPHERKPR